MSEQNTLQVFDFGGRQTRIVMNDGEPWWVLKDVSDILEYHDANSAARLLDDDEKGTQKVRTPGGMQDMTTINEPGLFKLILRSNKTEAKIFQRFVTHEVLPAIHKHGAYMTPEALERAVNGQGFTYDEENQMMVFTLDEKKHIRVAYSVGRVWYAAFDIANPSFAVSNNAIAKCA